MMRREILAIAAMLLAGAAPATAQDASKGEAVFKRCRACHAIGPGGAEQGRPRAHRHRRQEGGQRARVQLFRRDEGGGRPRASCGRSRSLRSSSSRPTPFMPNNVMAFPGIKNPGDLNDLIAFLKLHK